MAEFLAIPLLIVFGFFGLAILIYVIDHDAGARAHWGPLRTFLGRYVGDSASSTSLLTTIAGGLITVTSITFSILLLAVQQGASALTSQIIDHYLRRWSNRVYFGFFVGASMFALVTLVLTTAGSRPVLGVTFAILFTGAALFALILLIYATIDQIRPSSVIATIHDAALAARSAQAGWLPATGVPRAPAAGTALRTDRDGHLTRVRLDELQRLLALEPGRTLHIAPSVGDWLAAGDLLATIEGPAPDEALVRALRHALPVEEQRDLACDAQLSVEHLINIAWTTISTAKSNPAVAVAAVHALGDLLRRWADDGGVRPQAVASVIVYEDRLMARLIDGFETLVVVASESMQHQSLATVLEVLASTFAQLPEAGRDQVEALLLTSLSTLGDHAPTRRLQAAMVAVGCALRRAGRRAAATTLDEGWRALAATRGRLSSRGNRD